MKYVFLSLLLLASVSLFIPANAEIEKGINYDKEILQSFPDGSQKIKWTSTPERILHNNQYKNFLFTDNGDSLQLETMHGSIKLDKSSCGFSFYNKGFINGSPLFVDNITPKMANDGSENWTEINQIVNASCETYFDQDNNALVAKKYSAGIGFIEYKYIFTNGKFKTQLEATNLSSFTNKKFGFTHTIDLNRDVIKWAGTNKNLNNYNNQTFNRTWIENNESKVLDFLNNFKFDLDIAINNLDSVYVLDTGINKSKLSFNYFHNASVLMPNEKLVIDPTYSSTSGTIGRVWDDSAGVDCDVGANQDTNDSFPVRWTSVDAEDCLFGYFDYDTSSIPDSATITDSHFKYEVYSVTSAINCDVVSMGSTRGSDTAANKFAAILGGTVFVSNDATCATTGTGKDIDLGATADSEIQSKLSSDFFTFGIRHNDRVKDATLHLSQIRLTIGTPNPTLEITYTSTPAPDSIIDLSSSAIGQTTATLTFTPPNLHGETLINYMLNVTTPQASPVTTFKQNGTSSPFSVTGLTLGTSYSAQASAYTAGGGNWTLSNVYNFTTATFNPPGAPTLSAVALSDTAIRYTSIPGTAGDNSTIWYNLRCELNGAGSWSNIVSNSSYVSFYEYTGLTLGDENICQWRNGSVDGWSPFSNNATADLVLGVLQGQRTSQANPDDKLIEFIEMVTNIGGVYFGLGAIPFGIMLIGFMAGKKTVRIFTIATLFLMGMIHASGYYVYPEWYWSLALLFGIILVMGRMKSD